MAGRIRSVTSYSRERLTSGWALASAPAGSNIENPAAAEFLAWSPIETLNTVAAALRASGAPGLAGAPRRFDADDWWYRLRFDAPPCPARSRTVLIFEGLATVAAAWLNGRMILESDNMYLEHEVSLEDLQPNDNELVLRFRSLDSLLAARRPRPRWRTPMVENQQLRWFRTTLLGRTPGWSPSSAPVGPWRPIWLETRGQVDIAELSLRTEVQGTLGVLHLNACVTSLIDTEIASVALVVTRNGEQRSIQLEAAKGRTIYTGRMEVPNVALWWPHTHGEPALYDVHLHVTGKGSSAFSVDVAAGRIGFRTLAVDTSDGNFAVRINDTPVFCRGACWTPLDCAAPHGDTADVETTIAQARAAGMNMLRVGGTMVYESDRFLDACDAQGMLLWQDFMFASMDYPEGDAAFDTSVRRESMQLLGRLAGRPCLTVLCGNSEGEQQAAMWGACRESWAPRLFHELLPQQCATHAPGIPYWPSSAHGGAFPHQGNSGTTSYYGVGAYRRPLADARRAEIRFATECLAFANVPAEETLARMPGGVGIKVHSPQWKAGVPRDLGAGWDFEDVRDHYLAELFGIAPLDLRYADHDRYLELSRVVTGEAMAAALREWRRKRSTCNGALVWFLRDIVRGAGWGVVDIDGRPKAAWFQLRRVLQPRAVFMSDEGGNGVFVHVTNESATTLRAPLQLALYRRGGACMARAQCILEVAPRDTLELPAAALFEGFMDLSYAYRFGPPAHEVLVATLLDATGEKAVGEDFYFPLGHAFAVERDVGLTASARALPDGDVQLTLSTRACARYVSIHAEGFDAEDQYFHLAPGAERVVALRRLNSHVALKGTVRALNAAVPARIESTA